MTTHDAAAPAPAASLHETLDAILDHVRRLLRVSGSAFLIVDWDERIIRPEAAWFASDEVRDALSLLLTRPYDPERPGLTEAAIEAGRPLLFRDIESWPGAESLHERIQERLDEHAAAVAWAWYRSSCLVGCPMRTTVGRLLGVLAIALGADEEVRDDDLHALDVLAGLAALAVERSELLDREALRAHEEVMLNHAARDMAASLEVDAVYEAVVEHAARLTGATKVMLTRFEPAAQDLRTVAARGFSEEVHHTRFRLGEGMIGTVASTGAPYLSNPEDEPRYLRWIVDSEHVESFAHVPVALGPRLFGVLTVADERPGAIDEAALRRLEELVRLAAGAIANALDFQHERRIAQALARGFVPHALSQLEGLETGLVYEPAEHAGGGDFFGLWRLRSGATAVLLGDVTGKGLEMSAQSAMARFFVEARAWDCEGPADILEQVNRLLCARSDEVGLIPTFLAVIAGGRLRYSNAGHLPPLLVAADGTMQELATAGVPLGIEPAARCAEAERRFERGDLLVAATDGVVEARRNGEQYGEARLRALVGACATELDPQALAERAHREVSEWATSVPDDIVILAIRAT